ncbi:hypothetical protein AAVH_10022 [Aphelenchoides avenae]|nr:hypothetical protein AAVH_10022 [Aphelenchus avenae]
MEPEPLVGDERRSMGRVHVEEEQLEADEHGRLDRVCAEEVERDVARVVSMSVDEACSKSEHCEELVAADFGMRRERIE